MTGAALHAKVRLLCGADPWQLRRSSRIKPPLSGSESKHLQCLAPCQIIIEALELNG